MINDKPVRKELQGIHIQSQSGVANTPITEAFARTADWPSAMEFCRKLELRLNAQREALEAADECLALIEDVGHGARMENVTVARRIVIDALSHNANPSSIASDKSSTATLESAVSASGSALWMSFAARFRDEYGFEPNPRDKSAREYFSWYGWGASAQEMGWIISARMNINVKN